MGQGAVKDVNSPSTRQPDVITPAAKFPSSVGVITVQAPLSASPLGPPHRDERTPVAISSKPAPSSAYTIPSRTQQKSSTDPAGPRRVRTGSIYDAIPAEGLAPLSITPHGPSPAVRRGSSVGNPLAGSTTYRTKSSSSTKQPVTPLDQKPLMEAMPRDTATKPHSSVTKATAKKPEGSVGKIQLMERLVLYPALLEAIAVEAGELECVASGFVSHSDMMYVAEALAKTSQNLICEKALFVAASSDSGSSSARFGTSTNSAASPIKSAKESVVKTRRTTTTTTFVPLAAMPSSADDNAPSLTEVEGNASAPSDFSPSTSGTGQRADVGTGFTKRQLLQAMFPWTLKRSLLLGHIASPANLVAQFLTSQELPLEGSQQTALPRTFPTLTVPSTTHQRQQSSVNSKEPASPLFIGDSVLQGTRSTVGGLNTTDNLFASSATQAYVGHLRSSESRSINPSGPPTVPAPLSGFSATLDEPEMKAAAASQVPDLVVEEKAPLTLAELHTITHDDDVLIGFLRRAAKAVHGISGKLRVMSPQAVLRFYLLTAMRKSPGVSNGRDTFVMESSRMMSTRQNESEDWLLGIASNAYPRVSDKILQRLRSQSPCFSAVSPGIIALLRRTERTTLFYMTGIVSGMPLGINSRFNNNYLLPTVPIIAPFVGCGVHTRRSKEFFVSMKDRVNMLSAASTAMEVPLPKCPEEVLLLITHLSNTASKLMSSFALGALLACSAKWRELSAARRDGGRNQSQASAVMESIDEEMEKFVLQYCDVYNKLADEAFPTMRKQYPNVFVVSSFAIQEGDGGRPPMLTVVMSMIMKLLFLFAGGLESIRSDDRQRPRNLVEGLREQVSQNYAAVIGHDEGKKDEEEVENETKNAKQTAKGKRDAFGASIVSSYGGNEPSIFTDYLSEDVALAAALHVHAASQIVYIGTVIGLGSTHIQRSGPEGTLLAARSCSRIWRLLFQFAGFLPYGTACPTDMKQWLPLFPLYAVDDDSKRTMLLVYAQVIGQNFIHVGPVSRNDVLNSTAGAVADALEERKRAEVEETERLAPGTKGTVTPLLSPSSSTLLDVLGKAAVVVASPPVPPSLSPHEEDSYFPSAPSAAALTATAQQIEQQEETRRYTEMSKSFLILPSFAHAGGVTSGGHGSTRSAGKNAQNLRQELFELYTEQCVADYAPPIDLLADAKVRVVPGGLAGLSRNKLEDHSPSTMHHLKDYRQHLVLMVTFKPAACNPDYRTSLIDFPGVLPLSPSTPTDGNESDLPAFSNATPISVMSLPFPVGGPPPNLNHNIEPGDELTLRWGDYVQLTARQADVSMADVEDVHGIRPEDVASRFFSPTEAESPGIPMPPGRGLSRGASTVRRASVASTTPSRIAGKSMHVFPSAYAAPDEKDSPVPPPTQRHRVLLVLNTTTPNRKIIVLSTSRTFTDLPGTSADSESIAKGRCRPNFGVSTTRSQVSSFRGLGGVDDVMMTLVFPVVTGVLLHHRQQPPFTHDEANVCAWTNPQFCVRSKLPANWMLKGADPAAITSRDFGTSGALLTASAGAGDNTSPFPRSLHASCTTFPTPPSRTPFTLGWMLGQSIGNGVVFQAPLSPLVFRLIALAVRLEQPMEMVKLTVADIALLYSNVLETVLENTIVQGGSMLGALGHIDDYAAEVVDKQLSIVMAASASGSPMWVRRHRHMTGVAITKEVVSYLWNLRSEAGCDSHLFWNEVVRGLRATPLLDTPLVENCCARTLRNVLCGPMHYAVEEFSFKDAFLISVEGYDGERVYRRVVRKKILRLLDDGFSTHEKRALLLFITGQTTVTHHNKAEVLRVLMSGRLVDSITHEVTESSEGTDLHHNDVSEAVWRKQMDGVLHRLPTARTSDYVLHVPNYFEALLMGSYRVERLHSEAVRLTWSTDDAVTLAKIGTPERKRGQSQFVHASSQQGPVPQIDVPSTSCDASAKRVSASAFAVAPLPTARVIKHRLTLSDDDYDAAWKQLSVEQQQQLLQAFEETFLANIRAALRRTIFTNPQLNSLLTSRKAMSAEDEMVDAFLAHYGAGLHANNKPGSDRWRDDDGAAGERDIMDGNTWDSFFGDEFEEQPEGAEDSDNPDGHYGASGGYTDGDRSLPDYLRKFRRESAAGRVGSNVSESSVQQALLHGYRTAASFCFGDEEAVPAPPPAESEEEEGMATPSQEAPQPPPPEEQPMEGGEVPQPPIRAEEALEPVAPTPPPQTEEEEAKAEETPEDDVPLPPPHEEEEEALPQPEEVVAAEETQHEEEERQEPVLLAPPAQSLKEEQKEEEEAPPLPLPHLYQEEEQAPTEKMEEDGGKTQTPENSEKGETEESAAASRAAYDASLTEEAAALLAAPKPPAIAASAAPRERSANGFRHMPRVPADSLLAMRLANTKRTTSSSQRSTQQSTPVPASLAGGVDQTLGELFPMEASTMPHVRAHSPAYSQ